MIVKILNFCLSILLMILLNATHAKSQEKELVHEFEIGYGLGSTNQLLQIVVSMDSRDKKTIGEWRFAYRYSKGKNVQLGYILSYSSVRGNIHVSDGSSYRRNIIDLFGK